MLTAEAIDHRKYPVKRPASSLDGKTGEIAIMAALSSF
jgi:hypothetical protein